MNQGLHQAAHLLATNIRSLDQAYEQYLAYHEVRTAARINLDYQLAKYNTGTGIAINVLQAVTDWGNAISNEAVSLSTYNTTLATLERQSGTILESHGVRFYEERFGSIGPLGRFGMDACYPLQNRPSQNADRYDMSDKPAEEKLELQAPFDKKKKPKTIDYDDISLPTLEESVPDVPPSPKPESEDEDDLPTPAPTDPLNRSGRIENDTPRINARGDKSAFPVRTAKSLKQRVTDWFQR